MNSTSKLTDPLIEMCKGGDTKAFHQLYLLYSKRIFGTISRIVKNKADAEDLLQETFVDIFKHIQSYNYESHFAYWMKRIAINNSISHIRKSKEWIEFDNEKLEIAEENIPDHELNIVFQVEQIKQAITKLPYIYSTVFSLYAFEGYDQEEIAEILAISHNTVRTRYSRAKEKIKTLIQQMNCYA